MRSKKLFAGVALSIGLSMLFTPSLVRNVNSQTAEYVVVQESAEDRLEKIIEKEPRIEEYLPLIKEAVNKYKDVYEVDPLLVIALLKAETYNFDKDAISWAGAAGLAQIIGETAEYCDIKAYNPKYIHQARDDRRTSYRYRNKVLAELNKPDDGDTYVVKKGDTLGGIAKKKGKKLKDILDANPQIEDENRIKIGDKILIPGTYEESVKRILEYKRQYQFYKKKANDAFDRYEKELKEMTEGKTEAELRQIDERFVPEIAIDFCVKHMAELLKARNGDIREAVSAYNAGLRAVQVYGGIPPYDETVKYQNKVVNYYRAYRDFVDGKIEGSPTFLDLYEYEGNRDIEQRI